MQHRRHLQEPLTKTLRLISVILLVLLCPCMTPVSGAGRKRTPKPSRRSRPLSPTALFRKVSPAVVRIRAYGRDHKQIALGSGFFISADGLLVTNHHIVENARSLEVALPSNATLKVTRVLAVDSKLDIAILETKGKNLPYLTLATKKATVGQKVYAIGNPRGLTNTISDGMLSGFRKVRNVDVLQTTAPISPGSSGGPLVASTGEVLGITTFTLVNSQNLNFAVPHKYISALRSRSRSRGATTQPLSQSTRHKDLRSLLSVVPKELIPRYVPWTKLQTQLLNKWSEGYLRKRAQSGEFQILSVRGLFEKGQLYKESTLFVFLKPIPVSMPLTDSPLRVHVIANPTEAAALKVGNLQPGCPVRTSGVKGRAKCTTKGRVGCTTCGHAGAAAFLLQVPSAQGRRALGARKC